MRQYNNFIDEIDYLDSKFTESFEIANNLNTSFSNIAFRLIEEAKSQEI